MTDPIATPEAVPSTGKAVARRTSFDDVLTDMMGSEDSASRLVAFKAASELNRAAMIRSAAAEMASMSWGQQLSPVARAATARWCLEAGLDPLRHINVLGGNIYENANYYMDRLASEPNFSHWTVELAAPLDHRKIDVATVGKEAAAALLARQQQTNARRLALQMEWGVPTQINEYPDSAAAAVVTLHWKDGTTHQGCNWAGSMGRVRGRENKDWDPVGDSSPVKTAVTRAVRKAAKQCIPVWFTHTKDDALVEIQEIIQQGHEAVERTADLDPKARPVGQIAGKAFTQSGPPAVVTPREYADEYGATQATPGVVQDAEPVDDPYEADEGAL